MEIRRSFEGQVGIGQTPFDGQAIGIGQFAAQEGRQPGHRGREAGLFREGRSEVRLGLGEVAQLLAKAADADQRRGEIRLHPQRRPEMLLRLGPGVHLPGATGPASVWAEARSGSRARILR